MRERLYGIADLAKMLSLVSVGVVGLGTWALLWDAHYRQISEAARITAANEARLVDCKPFSELAKLGVTVKCVRGS